MAEIKPVATIRELMDSTVDPAADGVWESVATIVNDKGTERREPRTPEEWLAVRRHAITLIESMNLLQIPGRHTAPPGTKAGLGERTPAQIEAAIKENRAEFDSFAVGVQQTAIAALRAVNKKDPEALVKVGGNIDQACEACHVAFWYPDQQRPIER